MPKVACSTIKATLQKLEFASAGIDRTPQGKIHNKKQSPLLSISDIGLERFLELLNDRAFFKFCFVRNPYSRALSAYLNKIDIQKEKRKKFLKNLEIEGSGQVSFREFLESVEKQNPFDMNPHWKLQTYLLGWGIIEYDFVGRLENFDRDFTTVLQKIQGSSEDSELKIESRMEHSTKASSKIQKFYDRALQELAFNIYESDFKNLNYSPEIL
ncbi:MAG: sulfotransferase family protein [Cyanobacteriota bacterium]|nr:sulfotransferase family protein [Cyanobacteriota bacterium]